MNKENSSSSLDPYQPLDQTLKSSDVLNKWMLLRPRQKIAQLLRGQRVLDVCCGTGNLTAQLVANSCKAVGVDSSPTMLSHARQKHIAAEFALIDATQMSFRHEFDAAVISIALHEMSPQDREMVWASMQRAVRPKGRLIALDYTMPQHVSLFARIAQAFTERDECAFLAFHPAHYRNFQEFMRNGGLHAWVKQRKEPIEAQYGYWGGTVAVVICSRSEMR